MFLHRGSDKWDNKKTDRATEEIISNYSEDATHDNAGQLDNPVELEPHNDNAGQLDTSVELEPQSDNAGQLDTSVELEPQSDGATQ